MAEFKVGECLMRNGKYHDIDTRCEFDLMPRKRNIEQWIFSWANPECACVSVNASEEGAIANKKRLEGWGFTCSEIVQAPTLEVEE